MRVALFPGKFQPVHLGHVISVLEIYEDYDSIIICMTEDEPRILSLGERKAVFEKVFRHFEKICYNMFSSLRH